MSPCPLPGVPPTGVLASTVTLVPLYTDPAGSTGPLASVASTGNGWAIPWLPLLLVVVAVGAITTLVVIRKRALLSRRR
jgi:hypothetical protein